MLRSRPLGQNIGINRKVLSQGIDMCNIKAISLLVQKLWSRFSFSKVGQKSRSRSRGKKICFHQKGLATRNIRVKYESPVFFGSKVVAKVKFFFQKSVKSQGKGHEVKYFGIDRKVFSQEIHLCNIKALSPLVKKLWSRLSLLSTDRGRTDRQTDRQGDSYIPPKLRLRGYNNFPPQGQCLGHLSVWFIVSKHIRFVLGRWCRKV